MQREFRGSVLRDVRGELVSSRHLQRQLYASAGFASDSLNHCESGRRCFDNVHGQWRLHLDWRLYLQHVSDFSRCGLACSLTVVETSSQWLGRRELQRMRCGESLLPERQHLRLLPRFNVSPPNQFHPIAGPLLAINPGVSHAIRSISSRSQDVQRKRLVQLAGLVRLQHGLHFRQLRTMRDELCVLCCLSRLAI